MPVELPIVPESATVAARSPIRDPNAYPPCLPQRPRLAATPALRAFRRRRQYRRFARIKCCRLSNDPQISVMERPFQANPKLIKAEPSQPTLPAKFFQGKSFDFLGFPCWK